MGTGEADLRVLPRGRLGGTHTGLVLPRSCPPYRCYFRGVSVQKGGADCGVLGRRSHQRGHQLGQFSITFPVFFENALLCSIKRH